MHKIKEFMKNKIKPIYLSFYMRLLIFSCSLIVLVLLASLCITQSINTQKKVQINYKSDGNINYKVYLKPNEFYETDYLEENMTYVTSLIDYIEINYNDAFNADKKATMNYHYKVVATVLVTPKSNSSQVLFKKEYIIFDNTDSIINDESYNITKQIKLDYNKYNQIANDFKMTYGIECESKLVINKIILTTGSEKDYQIQFNDINENSLTIPLSEKQITLTKSLKKVEQKSNIITANTFIEHKLLFVIGLILIVGIIYNVHLILKLVRLLKPSRDKYQKELNKILNEYDRMIVNVNRMPDLSSYDVYKVEKFTELIDVRDNLKIPISYVKISKEKSCFYIKDNKTIYIYYLKSIDL